MMATGFIVEVPFGHRRGSRPIVVATRLAKPFGTSRDDRDRDGRQHSHTAARAALIPTPRPSGPRTHVHDIISNMSKARITEILTDACNDSFTDGIAFMVSALTAEANGGVR